MILLLSLCNALVNAARGSGIKGGKVIVISMMLLSAYAVSFNVYSAIAFPIPLLMFWWQKGGTGRFMKEIVSYLSFLGIGNNTWRFFEFSSIFIYSLIYLLVI